MARRKAPSSDSQPELFSDKELRGLLAASDLNPTERQTLMLAAAALYRHELIIVAGFNRLATLFGVCRRQAINRMRALERKGVLHKSRGGGGRFENGKGRVNIWELDLDRLRQPTGNGEARCTVKGEADAREGCNADAPTVKPIAQDPTLPTDPKKEIKRGPASPAPAARGGGGTMPRDLPDPIRPWVNPYANPEQQRAARLAQLRAQMAIAEKQIQAAPPRPVQFPTEGGISDGIDQQ